MIKLMNECGREHVCRSALPMNLLKQTNGIICMD